MKIGVDVLMVGLGVQLATILFFCSVVGRFHRHTRGGYINASAGEGWRHMLIAVYVSSGLIVVSFLKPGKGKRANESRSGRCID